MRLEAVLFDVGGTLVDGRDFEQWAEIARGVGLHVDGESIARARQELRPWTRTSWRSPSLEWQEILGHASNAEVTSQVADRFVATLEQRPLPGFLFSDARRCLERLQDSRRQLAIVSNSRSEAAIRTLLDRLGILEFFTTVVSSGTERVSKPDPTIFRRALDRIGTPASAALHVGDDLQNDARGASAAGLHSVWLNRLGPSDQETGFPELLSLSEVPRVVRLIEAGAPVK
jgi:HAD superfamily hydrolase (TIGR01509 family)